MKAIKKITICALFSLAIFGLTSCNSCTMMAKNWESNNSFLKRRVFIYDSVSGKIFMDRICECYASTSDSKTGDFSLIILEEDGSKKKYDYYGRNLQLVMEEQ